MDTVVRNQGGVVGSGACYTLVEAIPGDANVGKAVEKGHAVIGYALDFSKAALLGENGMDLESGRPLASPVSLTLLKSGSQAVFAKFHTEGINIPKLTIVNLKNDGDTAVLYWTIELTNVRITQMNMNNKHTMGGYNSQPAQASQGQDLGWGLDANPEQLSQSRDPNSIKSVADTFTLLLTYATITMIYKDKEGTTPAYHDFPHNLAEKK